MKTSKQSMVAVVGVVLAVASLVPELAAQSKPDAARTDAEFPGVLGGSGIGGRGGLFTVDGMWGITNCR